MLPIDGQTDAPEGKTWFQVANEHVAVIPQIESLKGVENAEEMAKIDGVDAISMRLILFQHTVAHFVTYLVIGRMDLTLDMGGDEAAADAAIKRVEAIAKKYGKPLLSFIQSNDEIPGRVESGYHLLVNAADIYLLAFGTNELMAKGKAAVKAYNDSKALNGNGKPVV